MVKLQRVNRENGVFFFIKIGVKQCHLNLSNTQQKIFKVYYFPSRNDAATSNLANGSNCNCNFISLAKLPWSGDSEGTFWSSSQAATCLSHTVEVS